MRTGNLYSGNREPTVDELLHDEIANLLMARDGLDASDVFRVVDEARTALSRPARSSFDEA